MSVIKGTWRNGRVELDEEVNWRDGISLSVSPNEVDSEEDDSVENETEMKFRESADDEDDSVEMEKVLAVIEEAEPVFSDEEYERICQELETSKRIQKEMMRKSWGLPE